MSAVISDATMNRWWSGLIGFAATLTAVGPSSSADMFTAKRERMVRDQPSPFSRAIGPLFAHETQMR
jgi:hypothetical protein